MDSLTFFIIIAVAVFLTILIVKAFKIPKFGCTILLTGAPKTGKSTCGLWIALRRYFSNLFFYYIKYFFAFIFKLPKPEKPLLYSNVKLAGLKYVLTTKELLLRKKRFRYGSVAYMQEASLIADSSLSMIRGDKEVDLISEQLLLFNKLIGHEMRSGRSLIVWDTQACGDLHHSIKKCLNNYIKCHHVVKLPFFVLIYVREYDYSFDTGTEVNVQSQDIEETLKPILIPKKVWKYFDAYCYSALTDDLPVEDKVEFTPLEKFPNSLFKKPNLKMKNILTFRHFKTLENNNITDKKEIKYVKKQS